MLIEVKKDILTRSSYQVISELISLDLLARKESVMALLTDLNCNWIFFWIANKEDNACIETATVSTPSKGFGVIRSVLSEESNNSCNSKSRCTGRPFKRCKLSNVLIAINESVESYGIRESIEQYYDIASVLGPDVDMARQVANLMVRSIPSYHRSH